MRLMTDVLDCSTAGLYAEGARCALQAAAVLREAGNAAEAGRWLQRAARQYRSARMYDECLALLADHPEVAEAIPANEVPHSGQFLLEDEWLGCTVACTLRSCAGPVPWSVMPNRVKTRLLVTILDSLEQPAY